MRQSICSKCEDYEFCKITNYHNFLTGEKNPIVSDNVTEAIMMYSKTSAEGVVFSDERYMEYPAKVIQLYRIIADTANKKKKEEIAKGK